MGWESSDRRKFLPKDWEKRREARFRLDGYQCTATNANTGDRCTQPAEECDHVRGRGNHDLTNLRSLCSWHHMQKTQREAAAARAASSKKIAARFRRET